MSLHDAIIATQKQTLEHMAGHVADLTAMVDQQTAELVRLRAALIVAEAALSDIGDADREPSDDLAWCERRAAEAIPTARAALEPKP